MSGFYNHATYPYTVRTVLERFIVETVEKLKHTNDMPGLNAKAEAVLTAIADYMHGLVDEGRIADFTVSAHLGHSAIAGVSMLYTDKNGPHNFTFALPEEMQWKPAPFAPYRSPAVVQHDKLLARIAELEESLHTHQAATNAIQWTAEQLTKVEDPIEAYERAMKVC